MIDPKEDKRLTVQAQSIRARWAQAGHGGVISLGGKPRRIRNESSLTGGGGRGGSYSGSDLNDLTADFQGDWRSADSFMRFDLQRVRNRSRQVERGNPWGSSFKKSLLDNVVGHNGFRLNPNVMTSQARGDGTSGERDVDAEQLIKAARKVFEEAGNFTTKKKLHCIDVDKLLLARLCFDGEIIIRKRPGFKNDCNFSWQIIDPDYLDHQLNRIHTNGNMIKMGVELDKTDKFPVAYWFLHRRPNDFFYNYGFYHEQRYYRVPAEDVMHIFMMTEDSEQTRGFPWLFSALVSLNRMGKYEEAAIVNATIGASKMGFFKKTFPTGFTGNPQEDIEDDGVIVDEVAAGTWWELPYGVEPIPFNPTYPEAEFDGFSKAMLRGIAAAGGCSYMSLTGDVSDANFSNLRAAEAGEHEGWKSLQGFFIRYWKRPEYKEWIYRAMLNRDVPLPMGKIDKFSDPMHTGRRWAYVNPVDDRKANQMAYEIRCKSISQIIRDEGGEPDEVFQEISEDEKKLEKLGIPVLLGKQDFENEQTLETKQASGKKKDPAQKTKKD